MKQVYLSPRSVRATPLRSDTLFGLIAWGVREVYGRDAVGRFLDKPPAVSSAFPFEQRGEGRMHWFPRPLDKGGRAPRGEAGAGRFVSEQAFLALVTGDANVDDLPLERDPVVARGRGGLFFLAHGPAEHYLEPALAFLERFGFGGRGSRGDGAFDVEVREADFVRAARPGETGLLLSLYFPTEPERRAIVAAARQPGSPVRWGIERRQGIAGGRLLPDAPRKRAVAMLREGSVLPCAAETKDRAPGGLPVVGEGRDEQGTFPIVQNGLAFLAPLMHRMHPAQQDPLRGAVAESANAVGAGP